MAIDRLSGIVDPTGPLQSDVTELAHSVGYWNIELFTVRLLLAVCHLLTNGCPIKRYRRTPYRRYAPCCPVGLVLLL